MDKQEEMNQQQTFVRMEQQQQKHLFLISGIGFVQIILETILLRILTKQPAALLMAEPILLLLQPPAELCAYGSASSVTTGETTYTWTCTGNDSLAVSCSATRSGTVVNGSCGTAQGQLYSTPPSGDSNLCSAGSPSLVTSGSLAYTWTCAGQEGL